MQRAPLSTSERLLKRGMYIILATLGLVLLSPLLIAISIAILIESGRPIIFKQHRKGFGGRPFTIYKFRTMSVCENGDTIVQATRQDKRITRLGRFSDVRALTSFLNFSTFCSAICRSLVRVRMPSPTTPNIIA